MYVSLGLLEISCTVRDKTLKNHERKHNFHLVDIFFRSHYINTFINFAISNLKKHQLKTKYHL